MATRTPIARNSTGHRSRSSSSQPRQLASDRSAFSWGDSAAPLVGAALAGAAIGFAANYGRKSLMQGMAARGRRLGRESWPPSMTWRWRSSTRCSRPTKPRPSSARCC